MNRVEWIVDGLFGQIPRKPLQNMVGAIGFESVP